ncbi:MAG: hypothetical protein JNM92_14215 [Zoogloea sp.]|nr:hypothetical protein [Zoogloea sp.]
MEPTLPTTDAELYLAPDHRHLRAVRAGTLILVEEGLIELEGPPRSLGEQMLRPRRQIEAGCGHVLDEDGWIGLSSARGARLRLVTDRTSGVNSVEVLMARMRCLRTLENRLLAAVAAALRVRLERQESPGGPAP